MKRIAVIILTVGLSFASAELFASNYADTYGMSAKSMGLGNAVTATVNDWTSLWYNPAGLGKTSTLPRYKKAGEQKDVEQKTASKSKLKKVEEFETSVEEFFPAELAVNTMYTKPIMNIKTPRSGIYAAENLDFGTSTLGIVLDCNTLLKMPEVISSARLGLAVGAGLDGSMYKVTDTSPIGYNYLRYGREAQRTMILVGAGFGFFNDLIGIGAGANVLNKSEAQSRMNDIILDTNPQNPVVESKMTLSAAPFLTAGMYISPEKLLPVLKGLELGAGYRQEAKMMISPFVADTRMLAAGIAMEINLAMFDFYSPDIFSGGLAYTLFGVTLSFSLDYEKWSGFNLGPGYEKGLLYYISNNDPTVKTSAYIKIPKMNDILTYRGGICWNMDGLVSGLSLLAGYYYQPSFVPDEAVSGDMNFLENDKHVGSIGTVFAIPKTWRFGGPIELSLSYQYQYLVERSVKKTDLQASTAEWNPDYSYGGVCHTVIMGVAIKI